MLEVIVLHKSPEVQLSSMTDNQEQEQPLAGPEVPLVPQGDAGGITSPPKPVPEISTSQHIVGDTPADSIVEVAQQPVPKEPAEHSFSVVDEANSGAWSADQYIPTDSDLAAALAQTPVSEPVQLHAPCSKSDFDVPSPSSALPEIEVTQILGVSQQDLTEHNHASLTTSVHPELDESVGPTSTGSPATSKELSTDLAVALDSNPTPKPAAPTLEPSNATEADPHCEVQQAVQQLDGVGSSVSSPAEMAGYHHPSGDPRVPLSYSGSSSYGNSGIHTPNYGFHTSINPTNHGYPPLANTPRSSALSLPSMRTFDPGAQHMQPLNQHTQRETAMSLSTLGTSQSGSGVSYHSQTPSLGSNGPYGLHDRYSLSGDAHNLFAGNRHKKEIKRRTKTGCLTCRKRRIKVRAASSL